MEQQATKTGSQKRARGKDDISGPVDALGYGITYLAPLRRWQSGGSTVRVQISGHWRLGVFLAHKGLVGVWKGCPVPGRQGRMFRIQPSCPVIPVANGCSVELFDGGQLSQLALFWPKRPGGGEGHRLSGMTRRQRGKRRFRIPGLAPLGVALSWALQVAFFCNRSGNDRACFLACVAKTHSQRRMLMAISRVKGCV